MKRRGPNNVLFKVKENIGRNLTVLGCAAYIEHNWLQHAVDHGFPLVLCTEPQGSARKAQGLRKQKVQTRGFLSGSWSNFHNVYSIQMYSAVLSVR